MSYAIHPYGIALTDLRKMACDLEACGAAYTKMRDMAARHDVWIAEQADPRLPTMRGALDLLAHGRGGPGFCLGYALQLLCAAHGRFLDNAGVSGTRIEWLETVDAALEAQGKGFRLLTLTPPPVPLPFIDDYPMVGFARREDLAEIASLPIADDPEIEGTFETLRAWAAAGTDVVTFYF